MNTKADKARKARKAVLQSRSAAHEAARIARHAAIDEANETYEGKVAALCQAFAEAEKKYKAAREAMRKERNDAIDEANRTARAAREAAVQVG